MIKPRQMIYGRSIINQKYNRSDDRTFIKVSHLGS